MKIQIIVTIITILAITSCTTPPSETPIGVNQDVVQEDKRRLLDFALSPNGDRLAVFDNTGVYIYELNSMNSFEFKKVDESFFDSQYGAIAFSPDGKQIAISNEFADQLIDILDIESNRHIASIEPPNKNNGNYVKEIEFSPNGQSMIVRSIGGYENEIEVYCEDSVDTLTLFNISSNSILFEIDQCAELPVEFSFTTSDKLFLYQGTMSPEYFVRFIDSNTGQIISKEKYDWNEYGNFYDVSPDGKVYFIEEAGLFTHLLDSVSEKELKMVEGNIVFFQNTDNFVVVDFENKQSHFMKNGEIRCTFEGIYFGSHARIKRKVSANQEVFAIMMEENTNLQVWDISSCEIISELYFER